jgi:hypothetical protein
MKMRRLTALGVLLALAMLQVSYAAPPDAAKVEIEYLLVYVNSSGCKFFRNDTWHDAASAEQHLRQKYDWLVARNQVRTAEDFIEKVATKSSLSGRGYWVRCNADPSQSTSQWLRGVLAKYRSTAGK